jgi:methionyl-tRNA formyltransferase
VVLAIEGDALVVATGAGALRLAHLQRPGKGQVTGAAFANGKHIVPGTRLG